MEGLEVGKHLLTEGLTGLESLKGLESRDQCQRFGWMRVRVEGKDGRVWRGSGLEA